ncbi:PAAR domain-containing protein [Sulfitobacter sp. LCG007]
MTLPAARVTDTHVCPMVTGIIPHVGGPIVVPCPTVLIGKLPAATATAMAVCVGAPDMIAKGSTRVLTGKKPQARLSDTCAHGGAVVMGCPTVLVAG